VLLLLADFVLGLLLIGLALYVRARRKIRASDQVGAVVTIMLASFGLAWLLVEGVLPGFWMIGGYALFGGTLEDHLLPGASIAGLLRSLVIGLVISTYASIRAYVSLIWRRRRS
jgi:hypothetical protein